MYKLSRAGATTTRSHFAMTHLETWHHRLFMQYYVVYDLPMHGLGLSTKELPTVKVLLQTAGNAPQVPHGQSYAPASPRQHPGSGRMSCASRQGEVTQEVARNTMRDSTTPSPTRASSMAWLSYRNNLAEAILLTSWSACPGGLRSRRSWNRSPLCPMSPGRSQEDLRRQPTDGEGDNLGGVVEDTATPWPQSLALLPSRPSHENGSPDRKGVGWLRGTRARPNANPKPPIPRPGAHARPRDAMIPSRVDRERTRSHGA